jgi:hypothetical protein
MVTKGYFVKDGKIMEFSNSQPIQFILANMEMFLLKEKDLRLIYKSFSEPFSIDAQAAKAIVKMVVLSGWMNVKWDQGDKTIRIELNSIEISKRQLEGFLIWAFKKNVIKSNDEIYIYELGVDSMSFPDSDSLSDYLLTIEYMSKGFLMGSKEIEIKNNYYSFYGNPMCEYNPIFK